MPDWISHVLFALILCELFNIRKKSLVMLGSIIPDLLKISSIAAFLPMSTFPFYKFLFPLHTPLGSLLVSGTIALVFQYDYKKAVGLLSIGWLSHFLLDLFQTHLVFGETLLLFPFSWRDFEFKLLAVEHYYYVILLMAVLLGVTHLVKKFALKREVLT